MSTKKSNRSNDVENNEITGKIEEKSTPYLFFCISVIALASFQDGFQIGCINAPGPLIIEWIKQSHEFLFDEKLTSNQADFLWSFAVSCFSVGGMFGSLFSGYLADRVGRRTTLIYNNVLAIIAATCLSTSKLFNFYHLIIFGRFLVGINCGITSGLVPMYLTELAPANLRGKCGSFHQLNISVAIVLSQAFGLPFIFGTEDRWPYIFAFVAVPSILQLIAIHFCPESPKYLITKKEHLEDARESLQKLRGHDKVGVELDLMIREVKENEKSVESIGYLSLFFGEHRWPMFIAIMMMFSQQLCGISAVTFYSTLIFKRNGFTSNEAIFATLGFGCIKLVATVSCLFLVDHPKFGRKPLHIFGLSGICISSIFICITISIVSAGYQWLSYLIVFFILIFVVSFAFGPGPIPWFFTSELFDSASRGKATSISASSNWIANWVVGLTFLPMNNIIGQNVFLVFAALTLFFIIFTWRFIPETKDKTPSMIREELKQMKKIF